MDYGRHGLLLLSEYLTAEASAVGLPLKLIQKYICRNETHYQFEALGFWRRLLAVSTGVGRGWLWERRYG